MSEKKKSWFGRHKILTVVGVIVVLIIIGAAASGGNKTTVNTSATKVSTTSSSGGKSSSTTSSTTAHVGSTVSVGGSKGLSVTLVQVIDPATGADQYTTADAGKRFVAVDVKIVNNGTAAFSDDANSDVTLIGSDNQSYTADFSNVSECTNFNSGQYTLSPGESSTGCVVFQVPDAVNSAKVQFQTQSGLSQSTGEWLVP
jgi:hypothetical protein